MRRGTELARFWIPVLLLVAFAGYVGQRLVRAHVDPKIVGRNYEYKRNLPAKRGTIYDACGEEYPLAKSIPVWEYHFDPVSLTNRVVKRKGEPPRPTAAILKTISQALDFDYRTLIAMSHDSRRRYQPLGRSSNPDAHATLANSRLVSGVKIEDRQIRQYLHGRRLSHVIGALDGQFVGVAGVEQRFNREMSGTPGQIRGMQDATGQELYDKRELMSPPVPGADVYLTIDHNLQYDAETFLAAGIEEFGAGSGWCIVLDAKTAAVLAMASWPDFDPMDFGSASNDSKINRAVAFTYEPGSVMKVITAAAGVDSGRVTLNTLYSTRRDDDRYYRLPGDGSHRWDAYMSVRDAIVHSSNIVIGKLGYDLGPKCLWEYMKAFGFGSRTGIELPGEDAGLLPPWKRWDKVKWSRAPIGQGVAVTAIQLASAYQTIANDGVRMHPHIVSKVALDSGEILYRPDPRPAANRVISPQTARALRQAMTGVASPNGTARRAAIRGYSVAGKTGTAQKVVNGAYSLTLFRATFCGIVPADEPRFVALVTLDFDEKRPKHQGGNSSALIFRRLATAVIRYLGVPPDRPSELEDTDEETDELDQLMDERGQRGSVVVDPG